MRIQRILLAIVCAYVALVAQAAAQVVRGVVVDQAGVPVRGAFVAILNEQGQQRTAVLTGVRGEYVFTAPPGRYSLRVDLIGHQTATVPLFDLAERETRTDRVVLAVSALKLPEISVSAGSRCDRMEASRETARVWNEARKALTVAAWVDTRGTATFRSRRTERDLDLNLNEIRSPRVTYQATAGQRVYRSASPDSLARFGYVQNLPDGTVLFGLDAELLLSNSFLSEHCFGLQRSADRRGLIGLTFQPLRGRSLPDIRGVLWLDERTAALRFIEYGYTGVPLYDDRRYAGGLTEFKQLPNGAWIVNHWYVRAPSLGRAGTVLRVLGTHEEGGTVLDAQVGTGEQTVLVPRVALEGVVFDSTRGRPLEGARVYLSGTPFFTMAGPAGRFRMDSIPAGEYAIAFEHPYLNTLPVLPEPVRLRTDSVDVKNLKLAVPSTLRIIDEICPMTERQRFTQSSRDTTASNRGVIYGAVSGAGGPLIDLEVGVTWQRFYTPNQSVVRGLDELKTKAHSVAVSIEADGRYTICSVPIDHPMTIDLSLRRHLVQRDSMRVMPPGLTRRDFSMPGRQ